MFVPEYCNFVGEIGPRCSPRPVSPHVLRVLREPLKNLARQGVSQIYTACVCGGGEAKGELFKITLVRLEGGACNPYQERGKSQWVRFIHHVRSRRSQYACHVKRSLYGVRSTEHGVIIDEMMT